MKILFSPSEAKHEGGLYPPINPHSFSLDSHYQTVLPVLERYQAYLRTADLSALERLFGIKKPHEIERLRTLDLFSERTLPALERYSGVAYDYLDYPSLPEEAQTFLKEHLILFSNLFGPLLGGDLIPFYKLKQTEPIGTFRTESYYKEKESPLLDALLEGEFIVDLRAGYYLKFYTLPYPSITMKFLKNGRIISHWAKAWRGRIVRTLAMERPQNEAMLQEIRFEGLQIEEIRKTRLKTEYIYRIEEPRSS